MRDLVIELQAQGHQVSVLVPDTNLATPYKLARVDSVEVLYVKAWKTKDVGMARRVFAEVLLPHFLLRGLDRSPLGGTRWDGVVWYSPTIFFGRLVARIKAQASCRSYLILRDHFPDWAVDAGLLRKGIAYRFFKRVERRQYRAADIIGVQTQANRSLVRPDCPAGARIEVLNNWLAVPAANANAPSVSLGPLQGRKIFIYAGNMGAAQGMDGLLVLAARWRMDADVGFLFVGRGSTVQQLRATAAAQHLDNVHFIDEIDADRLPGLLAQCAVGLIALDPNHRTHNIPGKLLTYLHAGLPVLARINHGNDLEQLINDSGVGFAVVGDNSEMLYQRSRALIFDADLRRRMGVTGKDLVNQAFSPSSAALQVVRGLQEKH